MTTASCYNKLYAVVNQKKIFRRRKLNPNYPMILCVTWSLYRLSYSSLAFVYRFI